MSVQYTYEIDQSEMLKVFASLNQNSARFIALGLSNSVRHVSVVAAGEYMIPEPGPHQGKLGVRTTRLIRAVQGIPNQGGGDESFSNISTTNLNQFSAEFGVSVPYGSIHEFGGVIPARFVAPKTKKVLAWEDEETGEWRYSKGHMIGPTTIPARPFMGPALLSSTDEILGFMTAAMKDVVDDAMSKA